MAAACRQALDVEFPAAPPSFAASGFPGAIPWMEPVVTCSYGCDASARDFLLGVCSLAESKPLRCKPFSTCLITSGGHSPRAFPAGILSPWHRLRAARPMGRRSRVRSLELRVRAQKHLEQNPSSPYWHQVLGEVFLLEGDGTAARRNIEIAQMGDARLPNLLPDLADAWFEIGDRSGSHEAFAEAADRYQTQLDSTNRDSSLLYYNLALCFERTGPVSTAIEDLQKALAAEPSAEWRKAIQAEITRLSASSSRTSPGALNSLATRIPSDAADSGQKNFNYEDALNRATASLLPRWEREPAIRKELYEIAQSGLAHHDRWLHDWLATSHTPISEEGDRQLAAAIQDGSEGDAQDSLVESRKARSSYQEAGNLPGRLRSQLAEIYALQRLDRSRECLAEVAVLEREPRVRDYAWIEKNTANA